MQTQTYSPCQLLLSSTFYILANKRGNKERQTWVATVSIASHLCKFPIKSKERESNALESSQMGRKKSNALHQLGVASNGMHSRRTPTKVELKHEKNDNQRLHQHIAVRSPPPMSTPNDAQTLQQNSPV